MYILTNADNARNYKLVRTSQQDAGRQHWRDFVTVKGNEKIQDVDIFRNFIVVYAKRDGLSVILCHNLKTLEVHEVELPEIYCVVTPGPNVEYDTDVLQFNVSSPFERETTYEYDMEARTFKATRLNPIHSYVTWRNDPERFTNGDE